MQAFEWLEKAADARAADLAWLPVRPVFDSLRSEPRFPALLERLGTGGRTGGRKTVRDREWKNWNT